MLPELDGLAVCRALRAESEVAIILLTARAMEEDKLAGLATGADDYVTKPFSPREVVARVRAVLRRSLHPELASRGTLRSRSIALDLDRCAATVRGRAVSLSRAEIDLLAAFLRAPGRRRAAVIHSLRFRLLGMMGVILAISLAAMGVLSSGISRREFLRFHEVEVTDRRDRLSRERRALEDFYRARGNWEGIAAFLAWPRAISFSRSRFARAMRLASSRAPSTLCPSPCRASSASGRPWWATWRTSCARR